MDASWERCLRGRDFLLQGLGQHGDTTRPVKGSPDSRLLVAVVVIHSAMEFSKTGLVWFLGKEERASSPGDVSRGWEPSSEWQNI